MKARRARIQKLIRDGKHVYYSYVDGKYFEHATKEEVRAHLKAAVQTSKDHRDLKPDAEDRFLQEHIFAGLPDLNTGLDSPLIPHFSPEVFQIVLERCAAHNVEVTGIEVFNDLTTFPPEYLDMHGAEKIREMIEKYRSVPGITFAGFYNARNNLSEKDRLELERKDAETMKDLEEWL